MHSAVKHSVKFSYIFDAENDAVYEAIINLKDMHHWNTSMLAITSAATMEEGIIYVTRNITAGEISTSEVHVQKLTPNEYIELFNNSGPVSYMARLTLKKAGQSQTEVITELDFNLPAGFLSEAKETVEAMATARISGNFDVLNAMLANSHS